MTILIVQNGRLGDNKFLRSACHAAMPTVIIPRAYKTSVQSGNRWRPACGNPCKTCRSLMYLTIDLPHIVTAPVNLTTNLLIYVINDFRRKFRTYRRHCCCNHIKTCNLKEVDKWNLIPDDW